MPANLENSAVAIGLEKVSFHSNPKERQSQRMLKLPHNCTHLFIYLFLVCFYLFVFWPCPTACGILVPYQGSNTDPLRWNASLNHWTARGVPPRRLFNCLRTNKASTVVAQKVKKPLGFNPWVGKIPWRRERLPTPVFWPGEFHGLYSPWGCKESDTTERLSLSLFTELGTAFMLWAALLMCMSHSVMSDSLLPHGL